MLLILVRSLKKTCRIHLHLENNWVSSMPCYAPAGRKKTPCQNLPHEQSSRVRVDLGQKHHGNRVPRKKPNGAQNMVPSPRTGLLFRHPKVEKHHQKRTKLGAFSFALCVFSRRRERRKMEKGRTSSKFIDSLELTW